MIYLVTNNPDFTLNPTYQVCGPPALLSYLTSRDSVGFDTETTGVDPHKDKLICAQFGDATDQYVVDSSTVDIKTFRDHLQRLTLLGHTLKFDLQFLFKQNIYPLKVYDCFVAERVINCGLPMIKASLAAIHERYLGIYLDKEVRNHLAREGLTPRVINYAALDVANLYRLQTAQRGVALEQEVQRAIDLENYFTPALAYTEFSGFCFDAKAWEKKMQSDTDAMFAAREKLDQWVEQNAPTFVSGQVDMFSDTVEASLDWNSPKQVVPFMESLGVDCTVTEQGKEKKSVEESVISKYKKDIPAVALYIDYKEAQKNVSTYGDSWIKGIHPITGKLHTSFDQVKDTGRISSGRKANKKTGEQAKKNFQNIPKDPITRHCFIASPGNELCIADFTGQEQIVLANFSLDDNLLKFYDEGLGDMHSFVASCMYPALKGLSLQTIKDDHGDKRQEAKATGFSIGYGGSAETIRDNLVIPIEDAQRIYNAYFEAFPGLKTHYDSVKKENLDRGYILISTQTQRKSYLPFYDEFRDLHKELNKNKKYWAAYRLEKKECEETGIWTPEFMYKKQRVRRYFELKGDIERKSLNYPIQGSSAEITKIAAGYIFHWIVNNGYAGIIWMANQVHDEIVLDYPPHLRALVKEKVEFYMEKAGRIFCKRVPLKVSIKISEKWEK